jgi:GNAT superfamily N-acetyltransferase
MKITQITENISHTSKRLHDIEKEKGVKPGTPEWFKLWFSLPYLKESITEAFDNPYPYTWDSTQDRYAEFGNDSFLAKAEMDMGELMVMFTLGKPGVSWTIDFAVDGSMDKTGDGDQFRIFATVVAVIKDWMANKVDLDKVTQIDFSSDKDGAAEDSRSKLYKRFGQQLASKLGWNLEVTDRGQFASFKIKNPNAPVEEAVEVSLHGDAKKGYVLSKIEVSGDERNAGQGTKAMQDIVDRMDSEGAIIALTPDSAFGGNKNRLIKFYKRFGFVPNKGMNKDYRFRETMIRYPKTNESVNEETGDEMLRIFQNMHHDAGNNDEMDAFIKSHDWELHNFTPDMFPSEEEFFDYDDPFGRVIDIDYHHRVDLSQPIIVGPQHSDGKYSVIDGNHRAASAQELGKTIKGYFPVKKKESANENFKDGKVKGKSRPGRVKKSGASCNGSVTELRAKAKKASGEKAKMYHWCANMKAGKKK